MSGVINDTEYHYNFTLSFYSNITPSFSNAKEEYLLFEKIARIIIPIIFGLVSIIGLVGNGLVVFVVVFYKEMRTTTNMLILNLAVADLLFVIFCVPFTAVSYTISWPFSEAWCNIYVYFVYVSVYSSVYTLMLMSLDRYLAVVHPFKALSIRTKRNKISIIVAMWLIMLAGNSPILGEFMVYDYMYAGEKRSSCVNKHVVTQNTQTVALMIKSFFVSGYLLPLAVTCVLYGFVLKHAICRKPVMGSTIGRGVPKKRITIMVAIVLCVFALCWLPFHLISMLETYNRHYKMTITAVSIGVAARCLAYINSCVNPILYAFLSPQFRKSFRQALCRTNMT